jgi:hypothetical protein
MDDADKTIWEQIRRQASGRDEVDQAYARFLAGESSAELLSDLLLRDPDLARLVAHPVKEIVSDSMRAKVLALRSPPSTIVSPARRVAAIGSARWVQWSSLAASLLVASSAGLYLGKSVGHRQHRPEPQARIWIDDVEGLGLEGLFPDNAGDS